MKFIAPIVLVLFAIVLMAQAAPMKRTRSQTRSSLRLPSRRSPNSPSRGPRSRRHADRTATGMWVNIRDARFMQKMKDLFFQKPHETATQYCMRISYKYEKNFDQYLSILTQCINSFRKN